LDAKPLIAFNSDTNIPLCNKGQFEKGIDFHILSESTVIIFQMNDNNEEEIDK